jgi:tRNA dimethylallyltransferase
VANAADSSSGVRPAPPLVILAGPTATGKTGLSIRLAEAIRDDGIPAEIISADSRQVYRGMDIGTAKVTPQDRAGVPHHGLDLVDPDEPFSVADFVDHARAALADLGRRGGTAILAGGTGLYLRAIRHGLAVGALPSDPAARAQARSILHGDGLEGAVARLRELAPGLAGRIDLANPRRVERSLEMALLRGDEPLPMPTGYPGRQIALGLTVEPAIHRTWIANRARAQFEAGLLDEADALRRRFDPTLPAFSAIGYREAWAVLDGALRIDEAIELDARRNIAFARRQRTWFRSEPDIAWLDVTNADPLPAALDRVHGIVNEAHRAPGSRRANGGSAGRLKLNA